MCVLTPAFMWVLGMELIQVLTLTQHTLQSALSFQPSCPLPRLPSQKTKETGAEHGDPTRNCFTLKIGMWLGNQASLVLPHYPWFHKRAGRTQLKRKQKRTLWKGAAGCSH